MFQGELVWFDPGVGHVLPGEVLEYHKPAQVLTVQAVIAGKVSYYFIDGLRVSFLEFRTDFGGWAVYIFWLSRHLLVHILKRNFNQSHFTN